MPTGPVKHLRIKDKHLKIKDKHLKIKVTAAPEVDASKKSAASYGAALSRRLIKLTRGMYVR